MGQESLNFGVRKNWEVKKEQKKWLENAEDVVYFPST